MTANPRDFRSGPLIDVDLTQIFERNGMTRLEVCPAQVSVREDPERERLVCRLVYNPGRTYVCAMELPAGWPRVGVRTASSHPVLFLLPTRRLRDSRNATERTHEIHLHLFFGCVCGGIPAWQNLGTIAVYRNSPMQGIYAPYSRLFWHSVYGSILAFARREGPCPEKIFSPWFSVILDVLWTTICIEQAHSALRFQFVPEHMLYHQ